MSPADEKPVIILLHGDDTLAMERFIAGLSTRVATDPGIADMNITRLDGKTCTEGDLRTSAQSMPFLAERRLVILTNPMERMKNDARGQFLAWMDGLPETVALVLVVEDTPFRKDWEILRRGHWLLTWIEKAGARGMYRMFANPRLDDMPAWIRKEATRLGGQITPEAARMLANTLGVEPQQASQELLKLLTYLNFERSIELDDVQTLITPAEQVLIFDLMDQMALGNSAKALRGLHILLETEDAAAIFPMVVRQFRLLLQTREILDGGGALNEVTQLLRQVEFVAKKLISQVQRFTQDGLDQIYHHLGEMDVAAKSSAYPLDVALEELIISLEKNNR